MESINPKVVELLDKLTYLELIESRRAESKNHEETEEYRFTNLGRMIALLFYCHSIKTLDKSTAETVYNQIQNHYKSLDNSHSTMCIIFLHNCWHNKELSSILDYMIKLLLDASSDKYEFLHKIRFLNMVFIHKRIWKIFEVSLEYLSIQSHLAYELFLFHLKLYIEDIMVSKCRKLKDYETIRLKKSQDLDTVVLEGYCSDCEDFSILSMETIKYLGEYIRSYESNRNFSYVSCPKCNIQYLNFEQVVDSQSPLQHFDNRVWNENQHLEKTLVKKLFNSNGNEYTKKSMQYQWIIHFLDQADQYHKITAIQD